MWAVGPTTATRATRPERSISCATRSPKVVLPAAGVAEARKPAPSCSARRAAASRCQARRGREAGQAGRVRESVAEGIDRVDDRMSATGRKPGRHTGRVPLLLAVAAGLALADASIVALALPPLLRELGTTVEGVA